MAGQQHWHGDEVNQVRPPEISAYMFIVCVFFFFFLIVAFTNFDFVTQPETETLLDLRLPDTQTEQTHVHPRLVAPVVQSHFN